MSKDKGTYRTLSENEIRDYLDGKVSGKEAHDVERHLLSDAFDSEAVEGFSEFKSDKISEDIQHLKRKIKRKNQKRINYLKVAAMLAFLLLSAIVVWLTIDQSGPGKAVISLNESRGMLEIPGPEPLKQMPPPEVTEEAPALVDVEPLAKVEPEPSAREADQFLQPEIIATEEVRPIAEPKIFVEEELKLDIEEGIANAQDRGTKSYKKSADTHFDRPVAASGAVARSASGNSKNGVMGQVTDDTGQPLPGVSVMVKGTSTGVLTDLNGNYFIRDIPVDAALTYSFIGFETVEATVNERQELNIEMEPDLLALNEVVVVGYGEEQRETGYKSALPVTGAAGYREYIHENLRYPKSAMAKGIEGKVVLKLTVSASGEIIDIEVKRSLGKEFDEEAIRLVREGPLWDPATRDGTPVEGTVRVKMNFELD